MALAVAACGPAVAAPAEPAEAPAGAYAVGVRTLDLRRGKARPLPTTVWYPAAGRGGAVAEGRFPLVVYSHGLASRPQDHGEITTRLAAAGFVVIAPAYPRTRRGAPRLDRRDLVNQPADAWAVVEAVSRLGDVDDPFRGHLDTGRVAAVGHSAGAYTSAGLFTQGHSPRLRGAVVIAGARPAIAFGGPPAPMLFVHGTADPTVPYATGRSAYDRVPWPKWFLTLPGRDHGAYLSPDHPDFDRVVAAVTDFLRWILYLDRVARGRLPR
jgi:fermentation-respiration switch protein FrsA (DUF1100 family)